MRFTNYCVRLQMMDGQYLPQRLAPGQSGTGKSYIQSNNNNDVQILQKQHIKETAILRPLLCDAGARKLFWKGSIELEVRLFVCMVPRRLIYAGAGVYPSNELLAKFPVQQKLPHILVLIPRFTLITKSSSRRCFHQMWMWP